MTAIIRCGPESRRWRSICTHPQTKSLIALITPLFITQWLHFRVADFQHGTVATSSETSVGTQPGGSVTSRTASETTNQVPASHHHHTGAKFRHGLLQLMIHTIDPLHDGQYAGILIEKIFLGGVFSHVSVVIVIDKSPHANIFPPARACTSGKVNSFGNRPTGAHTGSHKRG